MAYIDKSIRLSEAQAVTASAASTNVIDSHVALRNLGDGEPLWLVVAVGTAAESGGASTVTISLQDSADNSSFAVVLQGPAIAKATLVAGYRAFCVALPPGLRRYFRVNYVVATADLTAGTFDAFIVGDLQQNVARARGYTI
jgi:hypothetical protein